MHWTHTEEQYLCDNWQTMSKAEISKRLGRNYDSTRNKMRVMGLVKDTDRKGRPKHKTVHPRDVLTPEQYEMAKRFMWTLEYGGWRLAR